MAKSSGLKTSEVAYREGVEYTKLMARGGYATKRA